MSNSITTVLLIISSLSLILLGILLVRIFDLQKYAQLKRHRQKDEAVADLINYALVVDDGVILCKNGSFMAAWICQGEDSINLENKQKEYISYRINQALSSLGSGWMSHFDSIRIMAPGYSERALSHFPDRITRAMDEERRRRFMDIENMYEGSHILTVTYYPPQLAQAKFVELLFEDDQMEITPESRTQKILDDFKVKVANLESGLSSAFKLQRLKGEIYEYDDGSLAIHDAFLQYLHFCLTGIMQPIKLPPHPVKISSLIGGQELWGGTIPKIGDNFIQVVAIEGFPLESYPGILSCLADVPVACRFSSRFIFQDRHQAEAALEKEKSKWMQKQRGIVDQVFNRPVSPERLDHDAIAMVQDASEALQELHEGLVAYGYYTPVIVLMDPDRSNLETASRKLAKLVNDLGFAARVETINTLDAFLGSLPGRGVENVRRPVVHTMNYADLLPTSSIWTGENKAPCPFYPPLSPPLMHCKTTGNTPYRFNTHVRDVGHCLIVGQTGGGKSTLLAEMAAQSFRYAGNTVTVFDNGMSMYPLVQAAGGLHYSIGTDESELCFSPLQYLDTPRDRAWALEWIEKILILNNLDIGPGQRNQIAEAIFSLYQNNAGNNSLTDFIAQVQDHTIREALAQYDNSGLMGDLLSAEEDGLKLSRFTVFEIATLMHLGDKWSLPVLDYLFRRVEMANKGQPSWLMLDEAWLMLNHPVFSRKIREWLKVFRKANCSVVMATQNLIDFYNSSIFGDILESTASKIFLPNIYARNEEIAAIYRKMGLNSQQINIIASAEPKRHYYHVTEKGSRLFDMALDPIQLCFVGASDKDSLTRIKELENLHGTQWPDLWVKERTGLVLNDYTTA